MLTSKTVVAVHQIKSDWVPDISDSQIVFQVRKPSMTNDLTVCITSYRRPEYLKRAVMSCINAGIKNIRVSTMAPDIEMLEAISECGRISIGGGASFAKDIVSPDHGCNELWLRAAYMSDTERVLILHDDDFLMPEFGEVYESTIAPALNEGDITVTWRAQLAYDDGTFRPTEYLPPSDNGPMLVDGLLSFLLKRGRLSLSPIVTVFNRDTLISALKECSSVLSNNVHQLRDGMELGTEIITHYRQAESKNRWLYVNKVLSCYGAHPGSGTVQAQQTKSEKRLIQGYDAARDYVERTPAGYIGASKILFVSNYYDMVEEDDLKRIYNATRSVDNHAFSGSIIDCRVVLDALPRNSSEVGETVNLVPFVKDLIHVACRRSMLNDIIVLCNSDIILGDTVFTSIMAALSGDRQAVACERYSFDLDIAKAEKDGGFDLFAFKSIWWLSNAYKFPDMLLGREAWDWVFRTVIESTVKDGSHLDIPIYHQRHKPRWKTSACKPGQIHNLKLAHKFFKEIGLDHHVKSVEKRLNESGRTAKP